MASRDKLSNNGQLLIEAAIQRRQWTKIDAQLSQAATRQVLSNQTCINIKIGLKYEDVETLVDEGYLLDTSKKIRQEYDNFRYGNQRLNQEELDNFIDNGILQGAGISPETCRRFRDGKMIERRAFQILCATLEVEYELAISRPIIQLEMSAEDKKQQQLKRALGRFNHLNQWLQFQELTQDRTITLHIKNNSERTLRSKWLLNCLIQNLNEQQFSVNPYPQPLIVNMKLMKSQIKKSFEISDYLFMQIASHLKSTKKLKITPKKNSPRPDIVNAIVSFLNQHDSIILVFDKAEELGSDVIQKITNQFWKPLIPQISGYPINCSHCLILCYISKENSKLQDSLNQLNYLEIDVADSFNRDHLTNWMNINQIPPLFGLRRIEQINTKIEEIWNMLNCGDSVEPEALLQAIYQTCSCYEGYEEWTNWQTPTL